MLGSTRNVLIAYLGLVLAVSAVHANSEFQRVQRDHVNLKRFVKKRSPQQLVPVIGAGNDPSEITPASASAPVVPSASTPSAASASTPSATPSASGGLVGNIVSGILSGSASASQSVSASSSASSSSSVSSSASVSSSSAAPSSSAQVPSQPLLLTPVPTPTTPPPKSTVTAIKTEAASQETEVPRPTGAAQTKSTALMVLIIIASSIGGIAILWTIFRKWKLGSSSKFDERLQPIDWQPTDERDHGADGIIPGHRRAPSNASSFHSASAHGHRGNGAGPNNLQPIPDHDFTAGAVPIGGYADLARGPSPPMSEAHRGVGVTRGYEYDNAVPLHHQAGGNYGTYDYQGPRY